MPPTDASTDAGTTPTTDLPASAPPARNGDAPDSPDAPDTPDGTSGANGADAQDTLDLRLPDELIALIGEQGRGEQGHPEQADGEHIRTGGPTLDATGALEHDLLDDVGEWGPVTTPSGVFQLVPVRIERDLPLISRWMNDPAVAAFWELAGPDTVTADHLVPQLDGDGRSVPCLGVLDGVPMSYWEIYRADLDPLARHYPARPHDTGIHLLIGGVANRGRGLGTTLLTVVADLVLDHRPRCARVVAEPDLRNTPSVSAFLGAGFRFSAEVDLPDKRAALMVRDRALRTALQAHHSL
ncbi:GNAT family N-acetyltransferase [Streptomyces sp. NPDC006422]|uniref:GNAT family N-acetyltransferase n=1 Tax=unclassified Streptomyces TaxID=2593676 RepID=UPI0033AE2E84